MVSNRELSCRIKGAAFAISAGMFALLAVLVFDIWRSGALDSPQALAGHMQRYGAMAPIALMLLQFFQVVVPVLPGVVGCVAGVMMFGPVWGFVYNYVAVCLGSVAAYGLAYRFGDGLASALMGQRAYEKYIGWIRRHDFTWVFLLTILLPLAPDDIFCYLAGLARMKPARAVAILIIFKPWVILAYSLSLQALHLA